MRPTWGHVREFCRRQRYRETHTDHFRYIKPLPDRTTSGTMVSFGVDSEQVSAQRWRLVWKHQLRLASEDEFWKGLRGEAVQYASPTVVEESEPLPPYLRRFLDDILHYSESDIAATSRAEAQQLLNEYYSRELHEP